MTTNAEDAHHSIFGVTCKDDLLMPEKQALSFLKNRAKLRASPKYNSLDDSEGSVHFSCWLKFNGGVERFLGLKCPPSVPRDAFASLCESELVDALKARAQLRSADASWPAVHAEVLGLTDDQRTKLAEFVLGRVRAKLTTLK